MKFIINLQPTGILGVEGSKQQKNEYMEYILHTCDYDNLTYAEILLTFKK